jgi:chaperone required for assembly of F1-ATPase
VKRIWSTAAPTRLPSGGCGILLDDKPLKKPGGGVLTIPFAALAESIAHEWQSAGRDGREIIPDHLPFTRLATTAVERVPRHRESIVDQLAAYGLHDLLCYRADAPPALSLRQSESWDPWLAWAAARFGAALNTTTGVTPVDQPRQTLATFTAALLEKTDFELAGLGVAIPALGSLVLGLAFIAGAIGSSQVFNLSILDDLFQAERWGDDPDAEARRDAILNDLILCEAFWAACR